MNKQQQPFDWIFSNNERPPLEEKRKTIEKIFYSDLKGINKDILGTFSFV